jgi:hypothetical protein
MQGACFWPSFRKGGGQTANEQPIRLLARSAWIFLAGALCFCFRLARALASTSVVAQPSSIGRRR